MATAKKKQRKARPDRPDAPSASERIITKIRGDAFEFRELEAMRDAIAAKLKPKRGRPRLPAGRFHKVRGRRFCAVYLKLAEFGQRGAKISEIDYPTNKQWRDLFLCSRRARRLALEHLRDCYMVTCEGKRWRVTPDGWRHAPRKWLEEALRDREEALRDRE